MKPILIDSLVKEGDSVKSEFTVTLNDNKVKGWQIAKPLNHTYNLVQRISLALAVLRGKAIAVQYFEDLNESQKIEYVKKELKT